MGEGKLRSDIRHKMLLESRAQPNWPIIGPFGGAILIAETILLCGIELNQMISAY